jgi:hypothetical protein
MSKDVSKNSESLLVDQVFMLNKQFFIKKAIVARSVSLGIFLLFVLFAIYVSTTEHNPTAFLAILSIGGIFLMFFIISMLKIFQKKKKVPERIRITNGFIALDSKEIYFAQIKKLQITPPEYVDGSIYRMMTIYDNSSGKSIYCLGFKEDNVDLVFPEYWQFSERLSSVLNKEIGKFQFDL